VNVGTILMKITIDTVANTLAVEAAEDRTLDLYGKEAFELISDLWLKTSWNQKYSYTFTWMGRPIIQHPEDLVRLQEAIYTIRPDVIIETGVAHGGSLIFYASLMKASGRGRQIVGVDLEIRKHNRAAIESHELSPYIKLVEGDSIAVEVVRQATSDLRPDDVVMVILDSNHSKAHVLAELNCYAPLVSPGSYILATDGIMQEVHDTPRGRPEWTHDNPAAAALEFAQTHPEFEIRPPAWCFNESPLDRLITGWPSAWLQRVR
jgi:cephalosporin hydroxylase